MEKKRIFKRSKPQSTDKKVEKKADTSKKPAEKKSLLRRSKPAEPVRKIQQPEPDHPKHESVKKIDESQAFEKVVSAEAKVETAATDSGPSGQTASESQDQDIIVVEETTVSGIISDGNSSRRSSFIWIFLGIFIVFLSGGMVFLFLFQTPQKPEQVYTAPTDTPMPTKPAVPAASLWKIEILNGSGVPGAAAKMAQKLESLGYTVVKTGNADDTQTKTTFYLSKDFSAFADDFAANLQKEAISANNGGLLSENSISARIIIGTE